MPYGQNVQLICIYTTDDHENVAIKVSVNFAAEFFK